MVQYGRCQQEPKETDCSIRLRPLQRWYGILVIYDEEDVNIIDVTAKKQAKVNCLIFGVVFIFLPRDLSTALVSPASGNAWKHCEPQKL